MTRIIVPLLLLVVALVSLMPGERTPASSGSQSPTAATAHQPVQTVPSDAGNGFAGATLSRESDGHFYADAQVNGATIRFLVDSGASAVVLSRADAQRAGIAASAGEFTAEAQAASGTVRLKPVVIDRIAIGPVSARDVTGAVAETDMPISLLGQSFLARISHVEIEKDAMRLR
ncbi:retropepsin-like aspartic protease family protein [Sphingomonas colocasiae]|uniref:TIGR02281 family clan AA aspartic protease n=1 Tax=Sphingomonas colocasiae TaxID=1848973 RepID=A0ABS7PT74_9SPHN|nr:TIGR02281 family clan AA aspartic protease [Sphingomonas colocasiae]MBY8824488.1 TIGR02281 family clan AA aspartic protease [Sphingomonas colocasiae]